MVFDHPCFIDGFSLIHLNQWPSSQCVPCRISMQWRSLPMKGRLNPNLQSPGTSIVLCER